ncbi:MAG: F-type H+-transporting ATPase subunit b [Candidatus Hydrogenedentes bacterium]|nr:F-type H+-transporting ATPase subunit b [Candidatus Hydrogenedentota bacterium]
MVALNFTVLVEMVLFLVFLWITNRFIFQPLLRVMDAREAKLNEDRTVAAADQAEIQRIDAEYIDRLARAHHDAAQGLRQARYDAYQQNREEADRLRREADAEIVAFRGDLQAQVSGERSKYPQLLPGLMDVIDKWVREGGALR